MVNVKNLDLNLIRIFDALMEDRSVRRAALRLGLTQSAISHALNRLRYHLNDGVFVRTRDEINMVVPLDQGAMLKGLQGWQGPGWTAPDPGSSHYPEAKGGALIALFYLPAGRISYPSQT